ncbi:acyltransferase family protein [Pseudomonas graminis]
MLNNIQALRAFAALNVVFFHIIEASSRYHQDVSFLKLFTGWGASGVDMFFVISGFIMVYTQHNKNSSPLSFIKNRAIRIIPIYWLLSTFIFIMFLILPGLFKELDPTFRNFILSLLFSSQMIDGVNPVLYLGWTLEFEMLFYALFSIGLIFNHKTKSFIFPVVILLSLSTLNITPLIVLEFVLGMICAKVNLSGKFKHAGLVFFTLGFLSLIISIFYKPEIDRFFIYGIPSFFIVFGLASMTQMKKNILTYLGGASYSIYLIQAFTISAFYKLSSKSFNFIQSDIVSILALISTTIAGCIFYEVIEKPITKKLNSKSKNQTKIKKQSGEAS